MRGFFLCECRIFIQHFLVKIFSFVSVYSGNLLSYKINKLQESTAYHFRICAKNDAGLGPWSSVYTFITTKAPPNALKGRQSMKTCHDHLNYFCHSIQHLTSLKLHRILVSFIGKLINYWAMIQFITFFNFKFIEKIMIILKSITVYVRHFVHQI